MVTKPMTKTQIVARFAETMQVPKKEAATWIESYAALAVSETKKTGQFVLPGIGKLVKSIRNARKGRNPQTGEEIQIPKKTVVKFRVAKACKDAVVPPKK
jgi:DNA-binding protein HU-beta